MFGLLGTDENAATFALGWTLAKSRELTNILLDHVGIVLGSEPVLIELQRHSANDGGYSDIELRSEGRFHVVLEAKHGWAPPSQEQLARYAGRMRGDGERRLISLTTATAAYARPLLPATVMGVPVFHLSWTEVRRHVQRTRAVVSSRHERSLLDNLYQHLEGYVAAQVINSNLVYVVSLSWQDLDQGYSWRDIVEESNCYFHPYGAGASWPVSPPNYLGFRYDGRLQSVRHVDSYEIVQSLGSIDPRWASVEGSHILYRLGPPMRPVKEMRTGNLFRAQRVYCAIDTLLSGQCETISAAREETARRAAAS